MEFEVKKMELPEIPEFNFEELKKDLLEKTTKYENIIYNDNEISQAKKDRADLNKLKKAINDKRIAMEKEYMKPFNEFKNKVKEIIDIIDKPIAAIDVQVKEYERQTTDRKIQAVQELFDTLNPYGWLNMCMISDSKWYNASTSMKSIEDEINLKLSMIETELKSIETLDYKEQALEEYKQSLSMSQALAVVANLKDAEKKIMKEKQAQEEAQKYADASQKITDELNKGNNLSLAEMVEKQAEEPKEWMDMAICLSASDFDLFDAWTKENGIEWRLK